jgi:RNA polymerase sigma-70 factor (ECF subfamily)
LAAVLATLEIAYAQAYEDAAGLSDAAGLAAEVMRLSGLLVELLPDEPEVLGLAALVRLAEARRPARLDRSGAMAPLSEQDEAKWDRDLIAQGVRLLDLAGRCGRTGPYQLMAAIHACHTARLDGAATPWSDILSLYDSLALLRPSAVTAVNRAMALAESEGPEAGLDALAAIAEPRLDGWRPLHAARAALLERAGRHAEALQALQTTLALDPPAAERIYLNRKLLSLQGARL